MVIEEHASAVGHTVQILQGFAKTFTEALEVSYQRNSVAVG